MRVPILMYHQVSAAPPAAYTRYSVTPAQLARQIRWLSTLRYTSLNVDQLMRCRTGLAPWPERPLAITFDDGFRTAVHHALDVLPRYGFTATMFLVAGRLGGTSTWTRHRGVEMEVADWTLARDCVAAGFSCGAHTMTHRRLVDLDKAECVEELTAARRRLEDGLGIPVVHLAYPFGSTNHDVRTRAAAAGYVSACTVVPRLSNDCDDPLLLPRVPVLGMDSLSDFICRLHTARPLRQSVRDGIRRVAASWRTSSDRPAA